LHPDTPAEGMTLEQMFPGRDLTPVKQRMQGLMQEAGLPYGDRSMTYNSRLAQELGKWADSVDPNTSLHDLLYKAYFVDNINISDVEALVQLAKKAGLDEVQARDVLQNRSFEQQVNEDWQRSQQTGVTGVPTFFAKDLIVVGCQPYETLEKFVKHLLTLDKPQTESPQ
jgi:predicted DsbA family dithiol-disulfide isomerase